MAYALRDVLQYTDVELVGRLEHLVKADRALCAELVVHLGEVDARGLYRDLGHSSLYDYCRAALKMSEAEAYLRIVAARTGRRFPLVLERLGEAAVHLSGIKLLAPLLTEENHVQLLDRVRGMKKREIECVVAELAPKPDVPTKIRKLPKVRGRGAAAKPTSAEVAPVAPTQAPTLMVSVMPSSATHATLPAAAEPVSFTLQSPPLRASITPLSPDRFKLELTLDRETYDQLEQLQDLLRHQNPSGDLARILVRALGELRERTLNQRFAQTSASKQSKPRVQTPAQPREQRPPAQASEQTSLAQPREQTPSAQASEQTSLAQPREQTPSAQPSEQTPPAQTSEQTPTAQTSEHTSTSTSTTSTDAPNAAESRHIPRAVLREVYARDGGQCTFTSSDGVRCSARGFLEVHHHKAYARGGRASVDNLKLTCRAHNLLLAQRDFGRGFMQQKLAAAQKSKERRA